MLCLSSFELCSRWVPLMRAVGDFEGDEAFQKGLCYSFPTPHYNNQSEAEQGYYITLTKTLNRMRCRIRLIAPMAEAIFYKHCHYGIPSLMSDRCRLLGI